MKWRLMRQINLHLKRFARISLYFMLDPVQPWEFENGLLLELGNNFGDSFKNHDYNQKHIRWGLNLL